MIAVLRGISCFALLQLWHCLNQRSKRKKKIHSCGILSLSDVGSDVPGAEIKAAVSPFRYNIPVNGSTTLPQQHSAIFGFWIFPFSSGKWMWRRVVHDTAVIVLFSLLSSELGVDHDWRKKGESAHCAPATILSHTLQSCQSSKGKKMCSLNTCSGPLFFISCHIKRSLCSSQSETQGLLFWWFPVSVVQF